MKRGRLIRISVLVLLLLFAVAGAGYGASSGSQTITAAAAGAINITMAGSASIGSTLPGACGTTSSTVSVQSNRAYNLQIRSEPVTYPDGKPRNGATPMTNAFQWSNDNVTFINTTSTYANVYAASQSRTPGSSFRDHTLYYQQCVDWADDPATYTIVVEYLGVQP